MVEVSLGRSAYLSFELMKWCKHHGYSPYELALAIKFMQAIFDRMRIKFEDEDTMKQQLLDAATGFLRDNPTFTTTN